MFHLRIRGPLILLVALLVSACAPRATYAPGGGAWLDANALLASAGLGGEAADTLAVHISARNLAREARHIALNSCGPDILVRVTHVARRGRMWDAESWRLSRAVTRLTSSPVNPDWRPRPNETCLADYLGGPLAPGDSVHLATTTIAVDAILGDSLPPGPYRVTARFWSAPASWLRAGDVDLRPPRR